MPAVNGNAQYQPFVLTTKRMWYGRKLAATSGEGMALAQALKVRLARRQEVVVWGVTRLAKEEISNPACNRGPKSKRLTHLYGL